jgi:hypothetical protein
MIIVDLGIGPPGPTGLGVEGRCVWESVSDNGNLALGKWGCRLDNGNLVFGPEGWRFDGGRRNGVGRFGLRRFLEWDC